MYILHIFQTQISQELMQIFANYKWNSIEKFTGRRVNSTLNFTRKTDISVSSNLANIRFCKFVHFQGVFFPSTSCIFVFTIATIFACDSRQQYHFMYKCNSTLNTLSQRSKLTFSKSRLLATFYCKMVAIKKKTLISRGRHFVYVT